MSNPRQERIERMLNELRYEIERGIMENEIEETLGYQFYMPISREIPNGVVFFDLRVRPVPQHHMQLGSCSPRLTLVSKA